jgi:hypothetical protein
MSASPKALRFDLPEARTAPPSSLVEAASRSSESPKANAVSVPARHAYSHSASVGSASFAASQNLSASLHERFAIGMRELPAGVARRKPFAYSVSETSSSDM